MKVRITESQRQRLVEKLNDVEGSPLYHHTSEERAMSIMDQNKLRGSVPDEDYLKFDPRLKNTKDQSVISLTRDKNFEPGSTIGASWEQPKDLNVIFVLDSNKIKTRYKIEPFNYSSIDPRIFQDMGYEKNPELEERVLTKYIHPLNKYVTNIIYKGNNPEVKQKIDSFLSDDINESQEIKELAPTSAGVEEFVDEVKELSGSLKHLGFKNIKALQKFIEEAGYNDFQELKDDLEKFKDKKQSVKEQTEVQANPLPKVAIKLFKFLNGERKKYKKRADLEEYIKKTMKYIGLDESLSRYYLELYLLNYRPDGKYEDITPSTFVDPRKQQGKTITNPNAFRFTKSLMPFKGSNLKGGWEKDKNGVPVYVVTSYNWYPVLIHKEGKWYEVADRYSSSTSKQISNADPTSTETRWEKDLDARVYLMSPQEMKKLRYDGVHDQMMKDKKTRLVNMGPDLSKKRANFVNRSGWNWGEPQEERGRDVKIKFKINRVEEIDDKAVMFVDVIDVVNRVGNKSEPTPENYLKGEMPGVTKEKVENDIKRRLYNDFDQFVGIKNYRMLNDKMDENLVEFRFNHLKEK